jgi:hypothetical protein
MTTNRREKNRRETNIYEQILFFHLRKKVFHGREERRKY